MINVNTAVINYLQLPKDTENQKRSCSEKQLKCGVLSVKIIS